MNDDNKIIGNQGEEKQIPKLLRQAGEDKLIDKVIQGVEETSLEERSSSKGAIIGLEKVAVVDARDIKDISLGNIKNRILAVADSQGVRTYNYDAPIPELLPDNNLLNTSSDFVEFTKDGVYLAAAFQAAGTNYLSVYKDDTRVINVEYPAIDKIEFDSNDRLFVSSGSVLHMLRFTADGKCSSIFLGSDIPGLSDFSISPDGAYIVGAQRNFAGIFEVEDRKTKLVARSEGFDSLAVHVAFSPEIKERDVVALQRIGKDYYFAAANDKVLKVFKFSTPNIVEIINGTRLHQPHDINSIALGHGNSLAVAHGNLTSVYNLNESGLDLVRDIILSDTVLKAKFSPDGNYLAATCKDYQVWLYKVERK